MLTAYSSSIHLSNAQAVWYLKARALTLKNWIDDTEIEEEVGMRSGSFSFRPSKSNPTGTSQTMILNPPPTAPSSSRGTQGVAEMLLDENATAQMPRPGTSLARPNTQSQAVRSLTTLSASRPHTLNPVESQRFP